MPEYKYTKDMKKVVVVGPLNSKETIVQEIYVSENGDEIPGGEKFVVDQLFDKPIKSWHQCKIERLNKVLKDVKSNCEKENEILLKEHKSKNDLLKRKIRKSSLIYDFIKDDSFKFIIEFIMGEITHVLVDNYRGFSIEKFCDVTIENDKDSISNMKLGLVMLLGKPDGSFEWRVSDSQYYPNGQHKIYPCRSFEGARNLLENLIKDKISGGESIRRSFIDAKEKYNLQIPTDKQVVEYYKKIIDKNKKNISNYKDEINYIEEKTKECEQLISYINNDSDSL